MTLLIGFLTFILVMNCLFLMLLILIQLPKKEAGAGIAFGGAATDALFGAGSGNALTKLTKYCASMFVGMAVLLSVLHMHAARASSRRLEQEVSKQASVPQPLPRAKATPQAPAANVPAPATTVVTPTNALRTTITNQTTLVVPATNPSVPAAATGTATPEAPAPAPAPAK